MLQIPQSPEADQPALFSEFLAGAVHTAYEDFPDSLTLDLEFADAIDTKGGGNAIFLSSGSGRGLDVLVFSVWDRILGSSVLMPEAFHLDSIFRASNSYINALIWTAIKRGYPPHHYIFFRSADTEIDPKLPPMSSHGDLLQGIEKSGFGCMGLVPIWADILKHSLAEGVGARYPFFHKVPIYEMREDGIYRRGIQSLGYRTKNYRFSAY